ncbi:MAG: hypothetical protein GY730_09460 [bacterium]|nr:hypothetical protein [bacterium]
MDAINFSGYNNLLPSNNMFSQENSADTGLNFNSILEQAISGNNNMFNGNLNQINNPYYQQAPAGYDTTAKKLELLKPILQNYDLNNITAEEEAELMAQLKKAGVTPTEDLNRTIESPDMINHLLQKPVSEMSREEQGQLLSIVQQQLMNKVNSYYRPVIPSNPFGNMPQMGPVSNISPGGTPDNMLDGQGSLFSSLNMF